MDFGNLPILDMMTKKLSWLSRRTEVIAENIANAETPRYRASDLKEVKFRDMVDGEARGAATAPRITNARHLTGTRPNTPFASEKVSDLFEVTLDGNDVSLEQQLTRLGDTQLSYQATLSLYRKHMDMIRLAIKRPGG